MELGIRFCGLCFLAIGLFVVPSCRKPKGNHPCPLIVSLEGKWSECYNYAGLTDSLLYVTSFMKSGDGGKNRVLVTRIPLDDTSVRDTVVLELPQGLPAERRFGFKYAIWGLDSTVRLSSLPHKGWVTLPFPLGDTASMLRIGKVTTEPSASHELAATLINRGELFYVIDMHGESPRTVAAIEGSVLKISYPYLLLLTGYKYPVVYDSLIAADKTGIEEGQILLVDLGDMSVKERVSAPPLDFYRLGRMVRLDSRKKLTVEDTLRNTDIPLPRRFERRLEDLSLPGGGIQLAESPEGRWLIVYYKDSRNQTAKVALARYKEVTDSRDKIDILELPLSPTLGTYTDLCFAPGERWLLVSNEQDAYLWQPKPRSGLVSLLGSQEHNLKGVFFSSDGRHIGYVCQIRERSGYFLQVRLLPER